MCQLRNLTNGTRAIRLLCLWTTLFPCCACAASAPDPGRLGDGQLATVLESLRSRHNLPALAGFILQGGELREMAAVGQRRADQPDAVTIEDLWHLGSNTKAMTASLAALYVEGGALRWETTLAELFPEQAAAMQPAYAPVTVLDLLTHRSGLPANDTEGYGLASRAIFAERALRLKPARKRGTFLYSNVGYILAGHVLERIAGKPWEDLLRTEIFAPLDMRYAGYGPPGANGPTAPWGHLSRKKAWSPRDPSQPGADNPALLGPAGTVHARLSDYAKFVQWHLEGARGRAHLLDPATFARLHTPPRGGDYALGWGCFQRAWGGGEVLSHSGSNTMWFATVWLAPKANFAVFAVTNAGGDPVAAAVDAACSAMIQRVLAEDPAPE